MPGNNEFSQGQHQQKQARIQKCLFQCLWRDGDLIVHHTVGNRWPQVRNEFRYGCAIFQIIPAKKAGEILAFGARYLKEREIGIDEKDDTQDQTFEQHAEAGHSKGRKEVQWIARVAVGTLVHQLPIFLVTDIKDGPAATEYTGKHQ